MSATPTAIVGVNVIALNGADTMMDWTVLVEGDRITDMRPRQQMVVPVGATVIDGGGKYLLPGLVDMHVHIGFPAFVHHRDPGRRQRLAEETADDMILYLANGVTAVRNMAGAPFHLDLAARIDAGEVAGPRLHNTSVILDGKPPVWDFSPAVTDVDQARQLARQIKVDGYEAIKIYNHLSAPVYHALIDEGRRLGLPVVGHVPFAVGIHGALAAGQHCIEHFRGYDFDPNHPPGQSGVPERFATWLSLSDAQLDDYAAETERAGTWNCPTIVVVDAGVSAANEGLSGMPDTMRYVPEGLASFMRSGVSDPVFPPDILRVLGDGKPRQLDFIRRLHAAGNRLVVGTDCSIFQIVPGFSIHDELANFVAAGLTPQEALVCCCANPARYYGETDWGSIAPGMRADLVLLGGDPLQDISRTRDVRGVMAQGRWYDRDSLDAGLARNAAKYAHSAPGGAPAAAD